MIRQLPINQPFDLAEILYWAQDFRWCKWDDVWYSGVLSGNLIHIRQAGNVLEYKSHSNSDLSDLLKSYFRLDDDIRAIYANLAASSAKIARLLVRKHYYPRILRQPDPWECIVSYICSAQVRPATTASRVEAIAKKLGQCVKLCGDVRYTFPAPNTVLNAGVQVLGKLPLGYSRVAPAIVDAARLICQGTLDLHRLAQPQVSYGEARLQLTECNGVGHKIADCIALFALDKKKAFPVDSRVWAAVKQYYFPRLEKQSYESVAIWAQGLFGENAGYANLVLFQSASGSGQPTPWRKC